MFAKPRKGVSITMSYKAKKSNYPSILHPILIFRELARNYPYLILHPILHPNPYKTIDFMLQSAAFSI